MTNDLRPCPFCESTDLHTNYDSVVCDGCGAYGPNSDTDDEAHELWNTRPESKTEPASFCKKCGSDCERIYDTPNNCLCYHNGRNTSIEVFVAQVMRILDKADNRVGVACGPWQGLRERLFDLMDKAAIAEDDGVPRNIEFVLPESISMDVISDMMNELKKYKNLADQYDVLKADYDYCKKAYKAIEQRVMKLEHKARLDDELDNSGQDLGESGISECNHIFEEIFLRGLTENNDKFKRCKACGLTKEVDFKLKDDTSVRLYAHPQDDITHKCEPRKYDQALDAQEPTSPMLTKGQYGYSDTPVKWGVKDTAEEE